MEKIGTVLLAQNDEQLDPSSGLIECDGRSLLVEDYPELFAKIGTRYGGDGEVNFQIPNLDSYPKMIIVAKSDSENPPPDDPQEPDAPEETISQKLDDRIKWGNNVIRQFRVFTMGIPDDEGVAMLGNLMDVKMTLELGMLAAAGYLLQNKPADDALDSPFNDSQTVRERFVEMILNEGPTP